MKKLAYITIVILIVTITTGITIILATIDRTKNLEIEKHYLALGLKEHRIMGYNEERLARERINKKDIQKYIIHTLYDKNTWENDEETRRYVIHYATQELDGIQIDNLIKNINDRISEKQSIEVIKNIAYYYSKIDINKEMSNIIDIMSVSSNRSERYISMLFYNGKYTQGRLTSPDVYYKFMRDGDNAIQAQSFKLYEIAMGNEDMWGEEALEMISRLPHYSEEYDILAIASALKGIRSERENYLEEALLYLGQYAGKYGGNILSTLNSAKESIQIKLETLKSQKHNPEKQE